MNAQNNIIFYSLICFQKTCLFANLGKKETEQI